MISYTSEYIQIRARARACVCVWGVCHSVCACNIWIDEKLLSYFLFYISRGDHPCTVSDGPTKRPQYVRISRLITVTYLLFILQLWQGAKPRTSTTEFWFYTVVATWDFLWRRFQPICMVFLQSWPKATPRTLQWLFSIFGTYLEASLVAIVFSECFPLIIRFSFFNYCFPVNFADPFLSSVISMVAPTRCHGPIWGNPYQGECWQTWFQNWQF